MKKYVLFALIIFILSGCKLKEIGYRYADWKLEHDLSSFFDLTRAQDALLADQVDKFMNWHKQDMVPVYIKFLTEFEGRVVELKNGKKLNNKETLKYFLEARGMSEKSFTPLVKRMCDHILIEMKEEQVKSMMKNLKKDLEELDEESKLSKKKQKKERYRKYKKNFTKLFGSITKKQSKYLKKNAKKFIPPTGKIVEFRNKQIGIFRDILKMKIPKKEKSKKLWDLFEKIFLKADKIQSKEHTKEFNKFLMNTAKAIAKMFNMATTEQLDYVLKEIAEFKKTFTNIHKARWRF